MPVVNAKSIVIAGPTGAGKTTLAKEISSSLEIERHRVSDLLLSELGNSGRPRRDRLLSWLRGGEADQPGEAAIADRAVDLATVLNLSDLGFRGVVESVTLPFLLAPINDCLVLRVEASDVVRARRIQRIVSVDLDEALTIVRRKDAHTRRRIGQAWGVDLGNEETARWRADYVLRCPDELICQDPRRCAEITRQLAHAVIRVYDAYQRSVADSAARTAELAQLTARHAGRVVRMTSVLSDDGPYLPALWRARLLADLPTKEKAC